MPPETEGSEFSIFEHTTMGLAYPTANYKKFPSEIFVLFCFLSLKQWDPIYKALEPLHNRILVWGAPLIWSHSSQAPPPQLSSDCAAPSSVGCWLGTTCSFRPPLALHEVHYLREYLQSNYDGLTLPLQSFKTQLLGSSRLLGTLHCDAMGLSEQPQSPSAVLSVSQG